MEKVSPRKSCKLCYGKGFYNFVPADRVGEGDDPVPKRCHCLEKRVDRVVTTNKILGNKVSRSYKQIKDKYGLDKLICEINEVVEEQENDGEENAPTTD